MPPNEVKPARGGDGSTRAPPASRREGLHDLVDRARACCGEAWPGTHPFVRRLTDLGDRLRDARLRIAVLGQFKRGKSTFLNALLGIPALPTGVVPLTAIPTFIAWGPSPCLRVAYRDGREPGLISLADGAAASGALTPYVTEAGNPGNGRGVAYVELSLPVEVLRAGIMLIDTPGIGSTLAHNTATALEVLPECDVALFVVSADPPLTEAEATYLAQARGQVEALGFVLNKIDLVTKAERQEVAEFLRRTLQEQGAGEATIFPVSARQALAARQSGDPVVLEASGLPLVQAYLSRFLVEGRAASLHASVGRKARDAVTGALAELALRVRTLELPLDDLERRRAAFEAALRAIEAERLAARDLLRGDRSRLSGCVEDAARDLYEDARQHLQEVLDRATAAAGGPSDARHIQDALQGAIPGFFEAQLQQVTRTLRADAERALAGHVGRADALVETVLRSAADLFDLSFQASEASEPFRMAQDPYWVAQRDDDAVISLTVAGLARLLPSQLRASRLRRRWTGRIDALARRNAENLRWAILNGLDATFRTFTAALDARLAEALDATRGAIDLTLERRRSHAADVAGEIVRLRDLCARLSTLRATLNESAEAGDSRHR